MKKAICMALCFCMTLGSLMAAAPAPTSAATPSLTIVTEPIYDDTGGFSEGIAPVLEGDKRYYIDENGNTVIDAAKLSALVGGGPVYTASDFRNGHAMITGDDYSVCIDKNGNKVFDNSETSAHEVYNLSEGVAIGFGPREGTFYTFKPDGSVSTVDLTSLNVWNLGVYFHDGLIMYLTDDGTGFLDTNFKVAIKAQFQQARHFNNGLAPVQVQGMWGFIDKTGKIVIEPQYDDFYVQDPNYAYSVFNEGIAAVLKDGKWGHIDKSGNAVGEFKWEVPAIFLNGFGAVALNDKYGYIDTKGNVTIEPKYDDANYFADGIALVSENGEYKLIDTAGNVVSSETWAFEHSYVDRYSPKMVVYTKGDKRGIAKITADGAAAPAPVTTPPAPAPSPTKVVFNGEELKFDMPIVNRDGRTFYPMRELFTALGADVSWDNDTKAASGIMNESIVTFIIDSKGYTVNGDAKEMDAAAFLQDGKTYLPIRFAAEGLGFTVEWDASANTITIK